MNDRIQNQAQAAVAALRAAGLTVSTAESCTGGMVAAALTSVPGASAAFRYGWVTYCNEAKERELNVPASLIEQYGVVSEPVVAAMAQNAMRQSGANMAVAVSGNAGPSVPEGEPPAGTLCLALARCGAQRLPHTETITRPELDRQALRELATLRLLELIAGMAQSGGWS